MIMGKRTTSTNSTRSNTRNSSSNNSGRPRPMAPKSGFTKNRTRYDEGGKCY